MWEGGWSEDVEVALTGISPGDKMQHIEVSCCRVRRSSGVSGRVRNVGDASFNHR